MNDFSICCKKRLSIKLKFTFIGLVLFAVAGCQNSNLRQNLNEQQKIYIHETTKNYNGLIELYKNRLKQSDTEDTRYKLAQTYYLANDFDSARRVLAPLLAKTRDDYVLVLYGRVESKLSNYKDALNALEKAIAINNKNGEAYNLKGIVLLKMKQYDAARYAFIQARDKFYDENKVVNNLAMLSILNKEYADAYKQLNILYNKGYRNKALLHNLLYTLVKLNQEQLAKAFCIEHKLSQNPVILIQELKQIEPIDAIKFNEIVPEQEKKQKQYSFEKIVEEQQQVTLQPVVKNKPIISKPNTSLNKATTKSTILAVRSGEHEKFSRIAFETLNKFNKNDYLLEKISPTEFKLTIYDVTLPAGGVDNIIKRISHSNRDFSKVTGLLTADNALVLQIKTKHSSIVKDFYAGLSSKQNAPCFAFDFYLDNK